MEAERPRRGPLSLPLELPGSLLVVPLVALLFGSEWTFERSDEPPSALLARADAPSDAPTPIATYLVPARSQMHPGIPLAPGDTLTFEVPTLRHEFTLEIQGHTHDQYRIEASPGGEAFSELWVAGRQGRRGFQTRSRTFDPPGEPIRRLRVSSARQAGRSRIAGIRLEYTSLVLSHLALVPFLWGLWIVLQVGRRLPAVEGAAKHLLAWWHRGDWWLSTALVLAILFVVPLEAFALAVTGGVIALLLAVVGHWLRRAPGLTLFYLAFAALLLFVVLPHALTFLVARKTSSLFDLSVDHRMRPDGREINSDGIRFLGEADDLGDDDFVILVLGDSYTYGLGLDYDESYPYVLEELLNAMPCSSAVRSVNFGWGSSSPLLSLRLLRQVGAGYRPDLVVYTLDMTDFDDDLRYEELLEEAGALDVDPRRLTVDLLQAFLAGYPRLSRLRETLATLRRGRPADEPAADVESAEDAPERMRFFVATRPLADTRADIERGVMKNLRAIHDFARDELGVPMALVVYPRAFQYSDRESPKNWERWRYKPLGPFVREPFRYFEEVAPELPYPVFSLMPAFEGSETFPLFFADDPHWNRDGARLAARAVADGLSAAELVPCGARQTAAAPSAGGE